MNISGGSFSSSLENLKKKLSDSFLGGKKISVGVDVGSSSVKVVELEKKGEELVLKNYAIALGQEELIKPGTSGVISPKAGSVIKKTLEEAGVKAMKVNVAVPSFSSLITTIDIPEIHQDEIEKVVQSEAPKYIPVQLSDVVYGWQLIDEVVAEEQAMTDEEKKKKIKNKQGNLHILMVAIMKEISDQYDKVFSIANVSIDSLEIDSFSLTRSLVGNDPKPYLVLDIGHKVCNIIAVSNKNILLNRTIDVAGDRITRVIAKALNIDNDRAEKMKIQEGMDISQQGSKMVTQVLSVLTGEIRRTIKALGESYPKVEIEGIILSGGGSKLKGLRQFIESDLDIKTVIGNPMSTVSYPKQVEDVLLGNSPALSIATGLALLGFDEKN